MNKKRLIITSVFSIFLIATLLLGSTYSIFTSQQIDPNTNVYSTGNLSVEYTISDDSVQFLNINPMTEDEAEGVYPYRITVTNNGTVPYMFDVILSSTTASTDNEIDNQYVMTRVGYLESKALSECTGNVIIEDVILPADESVDIDVRVWLSDSIQNSEMGKSFYGKLSIDGLAVYDNKEEIDNSILSLKYMKTLFSSNEDYTYYRDNAYREKIKNASFVNYINTSNAISNDAIWDISAAGDNSVVAWIENNASSGYYDLYIGANNKIHAEQLGSLFSEMKYLENISFDNLSTSLVTNLNYMFYNCSSLVNLDLSNFNTSNVTNMEYLFDGCSGLINLNINSFNTSSVTSMYHMFYNCSSLVNLDLSNFDTSNVTTMRTMFYGCKSLVNLNLSSFDTSNVTTMRTMFYECSSLVGLDLSSFDTSSVTDMYGMFSLCSKLVMLNLNNFDTSSVIDMSEMFAKCSNLVTLDISSFDTSNVMKMSGFLSLCTSLTSVDLSNFNTSMVTTMYYMFGGCSSLTTLDLSSFNTTSVTTMVGMFSGCTKLTTTIDVRNSRTTYTDMFSEAATDVNAKITVNYTSNTSSLVDNMLTTKSSNSNVVKGQMVS